MGQYLITVLLLATVALSSSNILPLSVNYPFLISVKRQLRDNIYRSNKDQITNAFNKMYKVDLGRDNTLTLVPNPKKRHDDILNIYSKNDNYNGEGFRQEQWHNYPRQLDRLNKRFEQDDVKKSFNPDLDNERYIAEIEPNNHDASAITDEYVPETNKNYEEILTNDPLFLIKLRLARCLDYEAQKCHNKVHEHKVADSSSVDEMKHNRESPLQTQDNESENYVAENNRINKRIFSLWSRLQSLNHKGHELQHRRHLHAFYGLPDSDGGGALTAETRATLLRPPGSPLRWG